MSLEAVTGLLIAAAGLVAGIYKLVEKIEDAVLRIVAAMQEHEDNSALRHAEVTGGTPKED